LRDSRPSAMLSCPGDWYLLTSNMVLPDVLGGLRFP
jgi:hypothetical protein